MPAASPSSPLRIAIVGGGIAALELLLALHDMAGERVEVTLLAPEPEFVLRQLAVAVPFSRGHADRLALERVVAEHGGRFVRSAVEQVDAASRILTLATGERVEYDALVLAQGASEVPAMPGAMTFGEDPAALNGLLADIEEGYSRVVAFVVPAGMTWPLPLYEIALMTAEEAWAMNMDRVDIHLFTPEPLPLAVFGEEASAAVAELLAAARVSVHCGVTAHLANMVVETDTGERLEVDRVVALPVLAGRRLGGIGTDADGFVEVADDGLVIGLDDVYAIGDVTNRPVKQGGLACQQADAVAAHLAARAGADVAIAPLQQILRGRMMTGGRDRFLRRGAGDDAGSASLEPLWWPPAKVSGKYLTPYLEAQGIVHLPGRGNPPAPGVDVDVPIDPERSVPGGTRAADPLRPITPLHVGLRG